MSSIIKSKTSGLRRMEIIVGGKRWRIHLGRMPLTDIAALKIRVDELHAAYKAGRRDADAERWFEKRHQRVRAKLIASGLLPYREQETVKGLIDKFNESRGHVKASTAAADKQATDSLLEFFGAERMLQTITPRQAQEWRESLKGLAEATIAKRVIKARSLFSSAIKWEFLDRNPFRELRAGNQQNKARIRFIDDAISRKVLAACPDAEWRCIFAIARWGGMRIPSESSLLKWSDVFWDEKKIRISAPKTAHHQGASERWMVLLPELEKALLELHEQALPGSEFVLSARRRSAVNLRTNMTKIIERAGLTPWPKLFQNLRATLQTELCLQHPLHIVCNWIGNSPSVAEDHYLSVPDSVFKFAAQIAAQPAGDTGGQARTEASEDSENLSDDSQIITIDGRYRANSLRDSLRKLLHSHGCGAKSGALASAIVEFLKQPAEASP